MKIWAIWENSSGNWTLIMYLDFFSIKDDIQHKPPKIRCEGVHPVIFFEPQKSSFPALETQLTPVSKFPKGFFFRKWWKPVEMWQSSTTLLQGIHRTSRFTAQKTATKNSMAKKNDNYQGPLSRNEHQLCNDFLERCLFAVEQCKNFGSHSPHACPLEIPSLKLT